MAQRNQKPEGIREAIKLHELSIKKLRLQLKIAELDRRDSERWEAEERQRQSEENSDE
jgi:hypothetical protein